MTEIDQRTTKFNRLTKSIFKTSKIDNKIFCSSSRTLTWLNLVFFSLNKN